MQYLNSQYLIEARYIFTGQVEARLLKKNTLKAITTFLQEDMICRYSLYQCLLIDGGPKNKAIIIRLNRKFRSTRKVVFMYNPKGNSLNKVGYKAIIYALAIQSKIYLGTLHKLLPIILFIDRITVRTFTSRTPFYLLHGYKAITLIEITCLTQRVLDQGRV